MANPDVIRSLFTADCSLIVDRDGKISWCDEVAAGIFGVTKGSFAGGDFRETTSPDFPEAKGRFRLEDLPLGRIFAGEPVGGGEVCVQGEVTGDTDVWLSVTAEPVLSPGLDEVVGALVFCHDIT